MAQNAVTRADLVFDIDRSPEGYGYRRAYERFVAMGMQGLTAVAMVGGAGHERAFGGALTTSRQDFAGLQGKVGNQVIYRSQAELSSQISDQAANDPARRIFAERMRRRR